MKCIVPLAGGDIVHSEFRFRAWYPVEGDRLLRLALNQRAWANRLSPADYTFVLREVDSLDDLIAWLQHQWPGCKIIRTSHMSGGAMLTAMAGIAMLPQDGEPLVVDLADILFKAGPSNPECLLVGDVGALIPCFRSSEPCYSYLRMQGGRVLEAAEKRVISDFASAGVYFFRDRRSYLSAAAYCLAHADRFSVNGVHFVCPMANGIIAAGMEVLAPVIESVEPIGKIFH